MRKSIQKLKFCECLSVHGPLLGTEDRVHIRNKTHKRTGCTTEDSCKMSSLFLVTYVNRASHFTSLVSSFLICKRG